MIKLSELKIGGLYRFVPCDDIILTHTNNHAQFSTIVMEPITDVAFVVLLKTYEEVDTNRIDIKVLYNDKIGWTFVVKEDIFELING